MSCEFEDVGHQQIDWDLFEEAASDNSGELKAYVPRFVRIKAPKNLANVVGAL